MVPPGRASSPARLAAAPRLVRASPAWPGLLQGPGSGGSGGYPQASKERTRPASREYQLYLKEKLRDKSWYFQLGHLACIFLKDEQRELQRKLLTIFVTDDKNLILHFLIV